MPKVARAAVLVAAREPELVARELQLAEQELVAAPEPDQEVLDLEQAAGILQPLRPAKGQRVVPEQRIPVPP